MLRIVSNTDKGLVRDQNQDAAKSGALADGTIWSCVCDGMGGAVGGNIASRVVVDSFAESVGSLSGEYSAETVKNFLIAAVNRANALVCQRIEEDPSLAGMGTTVVACVVKSGFAHIAHVGDSRAYKLGPGGIAQLTKDHSMVQVLVEQGQIAPEEAKTHPKRNIITRAVGISRNVDVDYEEVPLEEGEMLLLCTDGVSGPLEDEEMLQIVRETDFFQATAALVEAANARGGSDNATAVLIG